LKNQDSFAGRYLSRHNVTDKIRITQKKDLRFIIVIPCFDEPGIIQTLESLWACERPGSHVEIIVVVNSSENADSRIITANKKTIREASAWANKHNDESCSCIILDEPHLPVHEAGPGLARKIGMDQAVLRLTGRTALLFPLMQIHPAGPIT